MGTCWPEALIKELVEGQKMASELQVLLHKPEHEHGLVSAEALVMKIVTTFTQSLSVLASNNLLGEGDGDDHQSGTAACGGGGGGEVYRIKPEPNSHVGHSHCDDRSSQDSGESPKRPVFKDRRGCYKRRKTSESRTVVLPTTEDGQAWRKYGQKEILNAPYPRAYFRCTRKYDQGCRATKQVQQVQDTPKMYQTTYIGHHTCRNMMAKAPQMILLGSDISWESDHHHTLSSESSKTLNKKDDDHHHHQHHHHHHGLFGSSSMPLMVKQEDKDGAPSSDLTDNLSTLDTSMWSDFKDHFELSGVAANNGDQDVVSNIMYSWEAHETSTTSKLDLDFADDFHFDESEFPIAS